MKNANYSGILFLALLGSLLYLAACSNGEVDDGSSNLSVNEKELSSSVGGNGQAAFDFDLPPLTTSFNLSAVSGGTMRLLSLVNPMGNEIKNSTTAAAFPGGTGTNLSANASYPFLNGTVQSGVYRAIYQVQSSNAGHAGLTVSSKVDPDPRNGTLRVNIVLVGPSSEDEGVKGALENSLEKWKIVYSKAGISIDPQWYSFRDGPDTLPDPSKGSSYYQAVSSATRSNAVNIVFSSYVDGLKGVNSYTSSRYGIAGGTPGRVTPSETSAIAISILALTGNDGQFDLPPDATGSTEQNDDETRIAAEEMARLTANYLGLPNSVEFNGSIVVWTDSLTDTPSCINFRSCSYDSDAHANAMFPFPVLKVDRNFGNDTYPRDWFSDQQRQVLNNSVLVE